ncbi:fumarylacetoacetate hydrolase family protein [Paraburkholderia caffeinilytica]|uniref:fumarylacetoacetate hydrolase family protein n=1 Tax=Paraburkholderia caffeinilytica TaxID=1761016 RepID=UPI003DA1C126
MRFFEFIRDGKLGLAIGQADSELIGLCVGDAGYPGSLASLIEAGPEALAAAARTLRNGVPVALDKVLLLPPVREPGKIICLGLNYADHAKEGGFDIPAYPTIFARFASSLIGHGAPIVRPKVSTLLDYEAELVAIVGKGGRNIPKERALEHVAGYSIFNDASIRDYQLRTPQWTVGKNFDGTGAFGPCFVTADELPPGASGLKITARLNGEVVQRSSTDQLIFDVASIVALLSEAMTLESGDVIVTGTPSGVGHARSPALYMKAGDVCEVEIEQIGVLRNPVVDA